MDFNTGTSGSGGASHPPGGIPGATAGGPGEEFNLSDPIQSYINAVRSVVTRPASFFRGIVHRGDYLNPLLFALICYEISAILGGIISLVVGNNGFGRFIVSLILTPIGATIGLFIGAGILHLLVLLLVKPNSGFEATFRVGSYATVTSLVSWIPVIGWIVSLYGIYLSIVGIREVHSTTTGRAAAVVLIPAVVVFVLVLILAVLVGVALFFGSQQGA